MADKKLGFFTIKDHQIRILHRLVSVFWFFKFGFKYDLGLGILIVLDWIGLECIGLHLGFGLNSVLSKEFGIEWFLISDICVRFDFSFG